jgi:hypothetical protein
VSESEPDEMLSIAYGNLVGVLVEAIKEMNANFTETKRELHELRADFRDTVKQLRAQIDALEAKR